MIENEQFQEKPVFFLFAGINGTGKTSFFRSIEDHTFLGIRVSMDETAEALGKLDDPINIIRSGKICLKKADECIEKRLTFNEETTLPGKVIENQLIKARKYGFVSVMYFIGVDSVDTAVMRVHRRIEKGGHAVPDALIRKRYSLLPEAVKTILPLVDHTFVFDNTQMFRQIALFEKDSVTDIFTDVPDWFFSLFGDIINKKTR